jgi:hypothetical protein
MRALERSISPRQQHLPRRAGQVEIMALKDHTSHNKRFRQVIPPQAADLLAHQMNWDVEKRFGVSPWRLPAPSRRSIHLSQLSHLTDHFHETIGVVCFGANWASPVMWAHYAGKHAGVALGFDVPDRLLSKIDYTDRKINVSFGAHLPMHGLSEELLNKIRMTKATDWSYEREYRVASELNEKDPITGLYYVDFGAQVTLREVIIGHRCTWTAATVRPMLGSVTESVRICTARPAFGKFEMVEGKRVKGVTMKPTKPAA